MDTTAPFILNALSGGPILAPDASTSPQLPRSEARTASAEPDHHHQASPALFTLQDHQLALHSSGPGSEAGPRPGEELVLGRHVVEDRSLNPKRVFFLPRGQALGEVKIEARGVGRWGVWVAGSPVGVRNGCLCAFLLGDEQAVEFEIIPQ